MNHAPLLLAAGVMLLAASAPADDGARHQLEQRLRLTASLLADSPTAQRISTSGNPAAVSHLDEGRVHHAVAEDRLRRGDLEGARLAVDEALHHVTMARRLAPDRASQQAAARLRHAEMLASTERLIDAWRARAAESPGGGDHTDMTAALGLLARSRELGAADRFEEALKPLELAQQHVLSGVGRLLHAATLDYTERAQTPADEYRIELARLQGLAELLPLALRELRPTAGAQALILRYEEASAQLRQQAEQAHAQGQLGPAVSHLHSAMLYLQRALSAAGVASPEPTGGPR